MDTGWIWMSLESTVFDSFKGVLYSILCRLVLVEWEAPFILSCMNALLSFIFAHRVIAFSLSKNSLLRKIPGFFALVFVFSPFYFMLSISMERTVLSGMIVAIGTIRLYEHFLQTHTDRSKKIDFALSFLFLTTGFLLRQDGLILGLMFILGISFAKYDYFRHRKRIVILCMLPYLCLFAVQAITPTPYRSLNLTWFAYALLKNRDVNLTHEQLNAISPAVNLELLNKLFLNKPISLSLIMENNGIQKLTESQKSAALRSMPMAIIANTSIILKERLFLVFASFGFQGAFHPFWEGNPISKQDKNNFFLEKKGYSLTDAKRREQVGKVHRYLVNMSGLYLAFLWPAAICFFYALWRSFTSPNAFKPIWFLVVATNILMFLVMPDPLNMYFWKPILLTFTAAMAECSQYRALT